jgi:hypothetical protein
VKFPRNSFQLLLSSSSSSLCSSLIFSSSFLGARISFYCYCRGHNKRIAETIHGTPYRRRKRRLKCVRTEISVPTSRPPASESHQPSSRLVMISRHPKHSTPLVAGFCTFSLTLPAPAFLFCFQSFPQCSGLRLERPERASCGGGY